MTGSRGDRKNDNQPEILAATGVDDLTKGRNYDLPTEPKLFASALVEVGRVGSGATNGGTTNSKRIETIHSINLPPNTTLNKGRNGSIRKTYDLREDRNFTTLK